MCLSVPLRNSSLANVSNRSSAEFKSVRMFRIGRSSVCSGPSRPSRPPVRPPVAAGGLGGATPLSVRPSARPWRRGVWGVQPPFPIRPCRPFPNRPCRPLHNRGPKHVYGGTAPRRTSSNQQAVPAAASSGSSQQYRGRQLWEGRREVGRSTSMVLARGGNRATHYKTVGRSTCMMLARGELYSTRSAWCDKNGSKATPSNKRKLPE